MSRKTCKRGHSLHDAYVVIRNGKEDRRCRVCTNERKRQSYHIGDAPPPLYVRPAPYAPDPNDPDVQLCRREFARRHPNHAA